MVRYGRPETNLSLQDGLDGKKTHMTLTRQHLAQTFVNLSQAYRDLAIDFSFTLFNPKDVYELRNLLQAVIRGLLALKPKPNIFNIKNMPAGVSLSRAATFVTLEPQETSFSGVSLESWSSPNFGSNDAKDKAIRLVQHHLEDPTSLLLRRMKGSLLTCHAVLMQMSGFGKYFGPGEGAKVDIPKALTKLRKAMIEFDDAESGLLDGDELPTTFIPEVIQVFAYCRPIRQAATAIEAVLVKVNEMEQRKPSWPRIHPPSYPWRKALNRTNAQVRHDRGGVTAGMYCL